jgi:NADH-quinone oxidoreductase subunit M
LANYQIGGPQWQFVEHAALRGFSWSLGIDGIALVLIVLTFLMPICIGASWEAVEKRVPEYMAAFLFMETLMIGVSRRRISSCSTSCSRPA